MRKRWSFLPEKNIERKNSQAKTEFLRGVKMAQTYKVKTMQDKEMQHQINELRALHSFDMDILNAIPNWTIVVDGSFNILRQNAPFPGYLSEVIGSNLFRVFPIFDKPEVRRCVKNCLTKFSESGYHLSIESGQSEWRQLYINKIRSQSGIDAVLLMAQKEHQPQTDISVLRSESIRYLNKFVSWVVHDIKNPLSAMLTLLDFLRREDVHNEDGVHKFQSHVDLIQSQADRIVTILENIRPLQGYTSKTMQPIQLRTIIERALAVANFRKVGPRDLQVNESIDLHVPDIYCCEASLQVAICEIYLNALEAVNDGGRIDVKLDYQNDEYKVTIQDDGTGIPAQNMDKIFELFYSTRSEKNKGGLGLTLANSIVLYHGGRLFVESEEGHGTTVTIKLPRKPHSHKLN
ncbi:HAMP domain-containing histidine kinase [candidate division KSB1 bacterium]|nr:HAMP domain-containing histidine kinase [candidate division KSB1 bacterium]